VSNVLYSAFDGLLNFYTNNPFCLDYQKNLEVKELCPTDRKFSEISGVYSDGRKNKNRELFMRGNHTPKIFAIYLVVNAQAEPPLKRHRLKQRA
jgi:hypothetical protein